LPDHLCENELFGHAKGAFTDASSAEKGLIAEAEGGTLFLDEIDTLSASAQTKLLRFLQDQEYRPLGSSKGMIADVRIIAATNSDLRQQVRAKQFREDLFYRLNVLSLSIPPLRDNIEDIPLLANHFLARYATQYRCGRRQLSSDAMQILIAYPWPGNVRELEGVLQRAVILCSSSILSPSDIDLPGGGQADAGKTGPLRQAKTRTIGQFERAYLIDLLSAHKGNVTHAAKAAGKERRTLQRLLHKYGLERQAFRNLI
jgi:two-component system response regulator AtoC